MSSKVVGKDLAKTPFMPIPKTEVEEDTNKKKKKKRRFFFWIFFSVFFIVALFTAIGVGLYLKYKKENTFMVAITIDPMVVDARGETHTSGGNLVSFNDTDSSEHYLADLEVMLSYNQYFVYKCTIENRSNQNLDMSFDISTERIQNCTLSYSIDGATESSYLAPVENISISAEQKIELKVFIKIADMDQNSYIKGKFAIYISEAGGGE